MMNYFPGFTYNGDHYEYDAATNMWWSDTATFYFGFAGEAIPKDVTWDYEA